MADDWVPQRPQRRNDHWWIPVIAVLATLAVLALLRSVVTNQVATYVQLNSDSMVPTIKRGERVWTMILPGLRSPVTYNTVVRYSYPEQRAQLISRVVALGGDTVELRKGLVYVNGQPTDDPQRLRFLREAGCIDETLPENNAARWNPSSSISRSIVVPEGQIFVLSDNRANTLLDSRFLGPLPYGRITGVVRLRSATFTKVAHETCIPKPPHEVTEGS